jgi:HK97 family phage major capsid protein
MAYTNLTSRTDAQALIREQTADIMLPALENESAALALFGRVPMPTNQTRFPVLSVLQVAYFVSGDTGLKQTTEVNWANVYINVEEIAVIVPVPMSVLDDVSFDIWGQARPLVEQAIARTLDQAIFLGVNKPSSWPSDIVTAAIAAGNYVTRTTATQATGGLAQDFSALFATVEADGYDVNGVVASRTYRGFLRGVRATTGEQLSEVANQVGRDSIYGVDVIYPLRGQWPAVTTGAASAIAGDFSRGVIGVRQDITWRLLDQAVIQDNTGAIVYNLAQQDMVAMRVVFRVGFQVANPINYDQATEASRYPFAVMREP